MVHSFSPGVEIETSLGKYQMINTVEDAAKQLLNGWPAPHGTAWTSAQEACLHVLLDNASASKARRAFLGACREADIFVCN
jgi:hypothetical protein